MHAKALELMGPVIGEVGARRSIERIDNLDQVADMRDVIAHLQPPS